MFESPGGTWNLGEERVSNRGSNRLKAGLVVLLGMMLVPAGSAMAAPAKPVATTGGVANVGESTVTLNGRVNPNQAETTYFFQYGTTSLYGAQTPATPAGKGNRAVRVAAAVAGLAPDTTYHYRLVAQNAKGLVKGKNRRFKTRRQPLGVTLAATPNPVQAGGATTLGGTLTGTGNAGRQVVLQANPFPYTQGFLNVTNPQVTNEQGGFGFPLLSVPVTTQYRVLMTNRPEVASPVVVLGAAVRAGLHRQVRHRDWRRPRVRFYGRLKPAAPGTQVVIQKLREGGWETVGETFSRDSSDTSSWFKRTLKPQNGGRYRVVANATGAYVGDISRSLRVSLR